jgi:hypothetical protein
VTSPPVILDGATRAPGPLAPLSVTIFRWLWIADVVSNIGGWMQTSGAQWVLVEQNASPAIIALVPTAAAAPVLLFGVPAGVLGEFANKRHLLIGVHNQRSDIALSGENTYPLRRTPVRPLNTPLFPRPTRHAFTALASIPPTTNK